MSNYLAQRLTHHDRITVHPRSELSVVHGTSRLTELTWRDHARADVRLDAAALFLMIGAEPCTTWLHERGRRARRQGLRRHPRRLRDLVPGCSPSATSGPGRSSGSLGGRRGVRGHLGRPLLPRRHHKRPAAESDSHSRGLDDARWRSLLDHRPVPGWSSSPEREDERRASSRPRNPLRLRVGERSAMAPPCQGREVVIPAFDQRDPLGAAPLPDLLQARERVVHANELDRPDQPDRPPSARPRVQALPRRGWRRRTRRSRSMVLPA